MKAFWTISALLLAVGCSGTPGTDYELDGDAALPLGPLATTSSALSTGQLEPFSGHQLVYVNLTGGTVTKGGWPDDNAQTNTSFIPTLTSSKIAAFNPSEFGTTLAAATSTILSVLEKYYAGYNVTFVATRPKSGAYTMVMVGGSPGEIGMGDKKGLLGISPQDARNTNQSDVSFVFSEVSHTYGYTLSQLAVTIAHEFGHSFGLVHIDPTNDVMNPTACHCSAVWGSGHITGGTGTQVDRAVIAAAFPEAVGVYRDARTPFADFNGDGKTDVVVRGGSGWNTTPVYLSRGDGTFTYVNAKDPSTTVFNHAGAQALLGDFDGDGKTDILYRGVTGWATTPLFFSNGDGSFRYTNAKDPSGDLFNRPGVSVITGDFNGDGKTDVALRGNAGGTVPVFLSNGDGTFQFVESVDPSGTIFNRTVNGMHVLVGDFDGDGRTDIAVRGGAGWSTTPIFFSNSDGTFRYSNLKDPSGTIFNHAGALPLVGDFDGDGRTDIALHGVTGWDTMPVFLSNGDGTFRYRNAKDPSGTVFNRASVTALVGDFNGDGKSDVVFRGGSGWSTAPTFSSLGDGTFSYSNDADPSAHHVFNDTDAKVLLGDFSGDGKTDVALRGGTGWSTTPLFVSLGAGLFQYENDPDSGRGIFNSAGAIALTR